MSNPTPPQRAQLKQLYERRSRLPSVLPPVVFGQDREEDEKYRKNVEAWETIHTAIVDLHDIIFRQSGIE